MDTVTKPEIKAGILYSDSSPIRAESAMPEKFSFVLPQMAYGPKVQDHPVHLKNGFVYSNYQENEFLIQAIIKSRNLIDIGKTPLKASIEYAMEYGAEPPGEYVWNRNSYDYCNFLSGNVVTCICGAKPERVFRQTECYTLIKNPNVLTINNVPRQHFEEFFEKRLIEEEKKSYTAPDAFTKAITSTYRKMAISELKSYRGTDLADIIPEQLSLLRHQHHREMEFPIPS